MELSLKQARTSQHNFSFADLCQLAECYGYKFARQEGSHQVFKLPDNIKIPHNMKSMHFQEKNGQAKPYQIKQLLNSIGLIEEFNAPEQENEKA